MTDAELLHGIDEMIEDAPEAGLCPLPFKIIRDAVQELVTDRDQLKAYRTPQRVKPYNDSFIDGVGRCPRCNAVFLDSSTPYCGNCGQALEWENAGEGRTD